MPSEVVDQLYRDFSELISHLESRNEISLRSAVDANFRKTILLAAASYFERQLTDDLLLFFAKTSNQNELVQEFVKNKAVSRQFHTYFDWKERNANSFFGLFGDSFKSFMKQKVKDDDELNSSVKAFLEIGSERDRLVHQDFGSYSLEKTAEEIYSQYQVAQRFVIEMPRCIQQFCDISTS